MENIIYRTEATNDAEIEFFVCRTIEVEPYRETRELAIRLYNLEHQFNVSINERELDSLIDFLTRAKEYIVEYNEKSQPKTT